MSPRDPTIDHLKGYMPIVWRPRRWIPSKFRAIFDLDECTRRPRAWAPVAIG